MQACPERDSTTPSTTVDTLGSAAIETAGDAPDVLVAMNPAALKTNLSALKPGGLVIVDTGEFTKRNLDKAHYEVNPLEDDTLAKYDVLKLDISAMTIEAVKPFGLGNKDALRCKNMWTLGLALWMFDRPRKPLHDWHPLLTGDPESTHKAGKSVRGKTVPEYEVDEDDWDDYIITDDA